MPNDKRPPGEWFDKKLKEVKKDNPNYTDEQARGTVGKIWYENMSEGDREKVEGTNSKESFNLNAAQFVGLLSEKYVKWIQLEAELLAMNNYGPWASIEEANEHIDKAVAEITETIKTAVEPEVERIVDEKREDILKEMSEGFSHAPNLPEAAPKGPIEEVVTVSSSFKKVDKLLKKAPMTAALKKKFAQRDVPDLDTKEIKFQKYGPGKFSNSVEEFLHEFAAHGAVDETIGNGEFGFYDLILFEDPLKVNYGDKEETIGGSIIWEDDNGFAYVKQFDTAEEAKTVWGELEEEYATFLGEYGEEGEEDLFRGGETEDTFEEQQFEELE